MFDQLTDRLAGAVKALRGQSKITDGNIDESLREVRIALLEADVGVDVVREFLDRVRQKALGQSVVTGLTPGQELIRIVRDELTAFMGEVSAGLDLATTPPVVILMAGLQGSGKTTTTAKLARRLIEKEKKDVALVSCDIHRPAAVEQLAILAAEVGATVLPTPANQSAEKIAKDALAAATKGLKDVLIVDTAGRLAIDAEMMDEIRRIHMNISPHETLFVIDSMMGQDAVQTARSFDQALPLTGVVLTKVDGDARGGAALSVRHVTGKPIKFLGLGEKTDALEPFHPDRVASRILGMGDVLSLIEEVEEKVDKEKAQKVAEKLKKGKGFDLQDFREQIDQMRNMGGLSAVMGKLPGMNEIPEAAKNQLNDKELTKLAAIIDSMTQQERQFPAVIKASRKKRIAGGSGTQVQDVNRLLKQFTQMQKMMKKMSKKGGMKNLMRGLGGQLPPGMPPR